MTEQPPPPPPQTQWKPQPWYQRNTFVIPAVFLAGALIFGIFDNASEPTASPPPVEQTTVAPEPEPEPDPEPPAAEGEYGSDSYFDNLYDDCESGSTSACDTLYWESPIDSEYESFALSQGSPSGTSEHAPDMNTLMAMAWDTFSASEQNDFCAAYNTAPKREMYSYFIEGAGDDIVTYDEFVTFFDGEC